MLENYLLGFDGSNVENEDRGYDDNKMFLKLDELKQDYAIRLTAKRKFFYHGKWVPVTQLRNQRKDKIKVPLYLKAKNMRNIFPM